MCSDHPPSAAQRRRRRHVVLHDSVRPSAVVGALAGIGGAGRVPLIATTRWRTTPSSTTACVRSGSTRPSPGRCSSVGGPVTGRVGGVGGAGRLVRPQAVGAAPAAAAAVARPTGERTRHCGAGSRAGRAAALSASAASGGKVGGGGVAARRDFVPEDWQCGNKTPAVPQSIRGLCKTVPRPEVPDHVRKKPSGGDARRDSGGGDGGATAVAAAVHLALSASEARVHGADRPRAHHALRDVVDCRQ